MKKLNYFLLLLLALISSSCLEIIEDIKVNNNGTGAYKMIVNLSQSKSQLDKILSQDSIQGKKIPKKPEIQLAFSKLLDQLKQQNGLSNVIGTMDLELYKIEIGFGFDKIESLNLAVNNIIQSQDPKAPVNPITYSFDGKTLKKSYNSAMISQAAAQKAKVDMLLTGFEAAKITTISRFEREILSTDHSGAKLSTSKKNCIEEIYINQLLTNTQLHNHNIILQ
jgi:hypothetical protein